MCVYQVRVCAHCAAFIAKKEVPPLRLVAFVAIDDRAVALAAATALADQVGPNPMKHGIPLSMVSHIAWYPT